MYGVRFVGTRGYVVTFRQMDPLYVLDLSNPADPRTAGELEMPGFSDHLVPLPNQLLLGVGRDATLAGVPSGVKLALFDVADAAAPKVLASQVMGQAGSASTMDYSPHGLNLLIRGYEARLALPVARTAQPWGPQEGGLQTLVVDTQARSLTLRPLKLPSTDLAQLDLWQQRSVQIEDQLYWLRGGTLQRVDW